MSTFTEKYPKRIIFVSGYKYRSRSDDQRLLNFVSNISSNYRGPKILVNNDCFDNDFVMNYISAKKELAEKKSEFYTDVLFNAALPSTSTLFLVIPNLTLRTLMHYLALLDEIKKRVYFVFDITYLCGMGNISRPEYNEMISAVPAHFKVEFDKTDILDSVARQIVQMTNKEHLPTTPLCLFNDIFWSFPPVLKPPLFQSIFNEQEFSALPFLKIRKTLNGEFEKERAKENVFKRWEPKVTVTQNLEDPDKTIELVPSSDDEGESKLKRSHAVSSLSEEFPPTAIVRDDNTDRARAEQSKKTQTVFDGSVAKVKRAPVERTEDGLPLKKRYMLYHICGPNGKNQIVPVEVKEEKVMSPEKSPSPIIKVEEDSDHEI